MQRKKLSADRLIERIKTLRHRHHAIDAKVEAEQTRPMPDSLRLQTLKQERLGLKDAIHVTRAVLARSGARQVEQA